MHCSHCPFTLPCYTGAFQRNIVPVQMCPKCKKFIVPMLMINDEDAPGRQEMWLYYFNCTMRPYKPQFKEAWSRYHRFRREHEARAKGTGVMVPDPMRSTIRGIWMSKCRRCSPGTYEEDKWGEGRRTVFYIYINAYGREVKRVGPIAPVYTVATLPMRWGG